MSKVLGVDIDYRSIRLALVENKKKPKLIKSVEIPVPFGTIDNENRFIDNEIDLTLREAIKKNKLHAPKVAVNIRNTMVREFSFNKIKEKEIKSALELELSSTIKDIAVSYQLNYKIYEKNKNSISGLVGFCPHKEIESALSYQEKLPGTIKYLDVYPNSLCKAIKYTMKKNRSEGTIMVVDIGYKNSIVTIIDNNRVALSRIINSGAYHLDKLVSEEISVSIQDAEIERKDYYKNCFARGIDMEKFIRMAYQSIQAEALQGKSFYEKNQKSVDSILLIGDGSEVPSIDLYMRESFNIPVNTIRPTDSNGKFIDNYHKLLPAIGSAIREV